MLNEILPLAQKMISIQSTANNPKALRSILTIALSKLQGYTVEKFERNGYESALIYNSKDRPKKFKVILNGHLDVIPGKDFQYNPKIKGNRLYGAGSMDMKANVACLITAFKEVVNKVNYPLGLQLVTDEEIGGFNGTKYQIDQGVRADFVIAGEPTNLNIVNKTKGILWIKVSLKGKSAHSAYPWRGENAIWKMIEFLNLLKQKYPVPDQEQWITTVNLSKIETRNNCFNKIPEDCVVSLDIRFVPEETDIIVKNINSLLPKGFLLNVEVKEPPLFVDENNRYVKKLQDVARRVLRKKVILYGANGSSDARHYTQVGCSGVEFGPIGGGIGSDNEWVDIPSLEKYYAVLKKFLLSI